MLNSPVRWAVVTVLICATMSGCGKSGIATVSGTLTYKGKPVTNAFINFVPETGRPSMGETDKDGRFTLTYDPQTKGAQIGKHRVFVDHNPTADMDGPDLIPGQTPKMSDEMKEFFDKYSGTNSNVEITIDGSTSDLKLDWD